LVVVAAKHLERPRPTDAAMDTGCGTAPDVREGRRCSAVAAASRVRARRARTTTPAEPLRSPLARRGVERAGHHRAADRLHDRRLRRGRSEDEVVDAYAPEPADARWSARLRARRRHARSRSLVDAAAASGRHANAGRVAPAHAGARTEAVRAHTDESLRLVPPCARAAPRLLPDRHAELGGHAGARVGPQARGTYRAARRGDGR